MKILFAATPVLAVPTLDVLVQNDFAIEILTNPDAPSGRRGEFQPSPIKVRALELGLTVHQPEKLDTAFRSVLEPKRFDLLVSFAFGRIFGPKFLSLFPQGGLNVHPSLLPRWRGPSPIPAALVARDPKTGITVQRLAPEMDKGDIVTSCELPLQGDETTVSLTEWAARTSPAILLEALGRLNDPNFRSIPQDEVEATYCALLKKEDARIDWNLSAAEIHARVRAYVPWPGAQTLWNGQVVSIWKSAVVADRPEYDGLKPGVVAGVDKSRGILVKTGQGLLALLELQLPSRKLLDFRSFLNGVRDFLGSHLGENA